MDFVIMGFGLLVGLATTALFAKYGAPNIMSYVLGFTAMCATLFYFGVLGA